MYYQYTLEVYSVDPEKKNVIVLLSFLFIISSAKHLSNISPQKTFKFLKACGIIVFQLLASTSRAKLLNIFNRSGKQRLRLNNGYIPP